MLVAKTSLAGPINRARNVLKRVGASSVYGARCTKTPLGRALWMSMQAWHSNTVQRWTGVYTAGLR